MRFDTFVNKKSIHFKIDRNVHLLLRGKLFAYDITMQELFDEFANLVVADAPKACSIVESILNKKMKSVFGPRKKREMKIEIINEIDAETLYNMINDKELVE